MYSLLFTDENMVIQGEGEDAYVLMQNRSLDSLIKKFLNKSCKDAKKRKVSIPALLERNHFIVIDEKGCQEAEIIGAVNENQPGGVFLVYLLKRKQIHLYNNQGYMVSRKDI